MCSSEGHFIYHFYNIKNSGGVTPGKKRQKTSLIFLDEKKEEHALEGRTIANRSCNMKLPKKLKVFRFQETSGIHLRVLKEQ